MSADSDTRPTLQELEELKGALLKRVHNGIHTSLEGARDLVAGVVCAPALAAQYLLQVGKFAEAHWLASNAARFGAIHIQEVASPTRLTLFSQLFHAGSIIL
ncbi:hypothetical protein RSOLAG1IB_00290 [Rhizoctonia solani AG-1 IB]|uniref:Uncharacterized protein n=1 Tax=Thanatephorus cucumeris (strain AG1-IB / isolate 7/3/14) TaxID=1108050 RepID=A0A0B7F2M2_THACB|nr:hypothetical protein RSOLAG1IB_00290 [Rhizoctonia solani AG-1 IB]